MATVGQEGSAHRREIFSSRSIAEVGVAIGLAAVLHLVRLWEMPQGGSITLGTMVPLLILALRRGPAVGALAGALYGLFEGWILSGGRFFYHPVQVILDYPLAHGLLGLAGFSPRYPAFGVVLAAAARYLAHVLSGVVFFASYAPQGQPVWLYSLGYNITYLGPEFALAIILTLLVWERLTRLTIRPA
ncbi:MAG: energy-coupled thiamine transporter ThiT [Armatimonadota bacterium]|nr:energy-coupled thiamine transporter ThiT [Armatimonadota bacterium]MDR7450301.1 energy-coupled thiamine transporter ThiT [Armatimonadota bacterium]MDR7467116.1 energy-coupled thiamine transporter ThiT [Armatimonadota bacterium]MDR7493342.1 energy-coupled thiamine transporter ThiT [Armatimonadota bacterium]MDR7499350.1 energy-coupled thiamine transporter ThiT [Armatimonadota bacterium]